MKAQRPDAVERTILGIMGIVLVLVASVAIGFLWYAVGHIKVAR